jgi:hypothetical protein
MKKAIKERKGLETPEQSVLWQTSIFNFPYSLIKVRVGVVCIPTTAQNSKRGLYLLNDGCCLLVIE